jgi:hypothetical protein
MARKYYSARKTTTALGLGIVKTLFDAVLSQFQEQQFLDQAFGFTCVDAGKVAGTIGRDPRIYFLRNLRKPDLWPVPEKLWDYSEEDLFDVIELLYDLVSEPVDGTYHSYNECGMHYTTFNQPSGQAKFRSEINDILSDYKEGYELAENGEIVEKADKGLDSLFDANLPVSNGKDASQLMEDAIKIFRRRGATITERRNAVRMLADIFEQLRPRLNRVMTRKDESDLFNLANNFAIRHQNDRQKTQYDRALWLSWMFYFYLATLHFATRRLEKNSG